MGENFTYFMDKKDRELAELQGGLQLDFESESRMFGTKAMTTRQTPSYYAMMDIMSKYIPLTSKAEIINEAITDAFSTFLDSVPEDRREIVKAEYTEEFNHYVSLIAPKVGEKDSGLMVTEENRQLALAREAEKGDDK